MKSKKIIAMIVAFAAFMAVATSGLAATVTTLTTYNTVSGKVTVDVDVTGASGNSEVTYLVTNSDGAIVYIDQDTADANGNVGFEYKIDQDDVKNLVTNVKFGTNGVNKIDDTEPLSLGNVSATYTEGQATVGFYSDDECTAKVTTVGNNDKTYVKVEAVEGYVVTKVVIGSTEYNAAGVYEMTGNQAIVVTTEEATVDIDVDSAITIENSNINFGTGEVDDDKSDIDEAVADGKTITTTLIKVTATPNEVGVKIGQDEYPAYTSLNADGSGNMDYQSGQIYAVRVITDSEVTIEAYAR